MAQTRPPDKKILIQAQFGSVAAFARMLKVTERYAWLWLQGTRKAARLEAAYQHHCKR